MMNQLTVKSIEFYGDETATVTVDSGQSSIEVFCHPCEYKIGDKIDNLLHVLESDLKAPYLSDWSDELTAEKSKERLEKTGPYSYKGCAKVVNLENRIIEVQGFRIEVDDIPFKDIVEFDIARLELW